MSEFASRRDFLGLAVAIPVGVVSGALTKSVPSFIEDQIGIESGNAFLEEEVRKSCKTPDDLDQCAEQYANRSDVRLKGIVLAPLVEEITYRAGTSILMDTVYKPRSEMRDILPALHTALFGNHDPKVSRKELIAGSISSLAFAASHNVAPAGGYKIKVLTDSLPVGQFIKGSFWFYLQRKLGIGANLAAHATNNFLAIRSKKM